MCLIGQNLTQQEGGPFCNAMQERGMTALAILDHVQT